MKEWIIINNPQMFDIVGAFRKYNEIDYKQSTKVSVDDIVYIYVSAPYQEIMYKCIATKVDMLEREIDTSEFNIDDHNYRNYGRYMQIRLLEEYDGLLVYDDLLKNGLKSVQGPTVVTSQLSRFIDDTIFMHDKRSSKKINVYFVFQNISYMEESTEGYLWAPKKNLSGHLVAHHDLMRKVSTGDFIIHSYNRHVVAISRALSNAYSYDRFDEEHHWNRDGWRVNTDYFTLINPIDTKPHVERLLEIQPKRLAPFNKRKRGNTGYLYNANFKMLDYFAREALRSMTPEIVESFKGFIEYRERELMDEKFLDDLLNNEVSELLEEEMNPDIYVPSPVVRPSSINLGGRKSYPRDKKVSANALRRAEFQCEIDLTHPSFRRRKTLKNYTEPHHIVPMEFQEQFDVSLDVEANIISLCSNCHNHIHYGVDVNNILKMIYDSRIDLLNKAGIYLDFDTLCKYYKLDLDFNKAR